MKKLISKKSISVFRGSLSGAVFVTVSILLLSFTVNKLTGDFLNQLGMSRPGADEKIAQCLLGGYVDTYGVRNVKNITLGNRTAVTNDLLVYIKQYSASTAFKKEYAVLKEKNKPRLSAIQTPEAMRKENIEQMKKAATELEGYYKKADASLKPMFEKSLADGKKQLKDAEDPNNKMYLNYAKNYDQLVKDNEDRNKLMLKRWEENYPENQLLFIKKHLQNFLATTADIDFAAETISKNGKKIFVKPEYEHKEHYWKMAYRAGKEVVEPSRDFVTEWLEEIK
jgi:hypothetical protein